MNQSAQPSAPPAHRHTAFHKHMWRFRADQRISQEPQYRQDQLPVQVQFEPPSFPHHRNEPQHSDLPK